MKEFKIYVNPQGVKEAVKQGWSWPGFFFVAIWALVKKMWALGGIVFGAFFVLGMIAGENSGMDLLLTLAQFGVAVAFGMNGNKWRESSLQRRGYDYTRTVQASNPEGAIAAYLKGVALPASNESEISITASAHKPA
jgi:hypothetical protein